MKLALAEVCARKDNVCGSNTKSNTLNGTALGIFETGRKFCMQVVGFLDGDFQERVRNAKRGAATARVLVMAPSLLDPVRLDLRR